MPYLSLVARLNLAMTGQDIDAWQGEVKVASTVGKRPTTTLTAADFLDLDSLLSPEERMVRDSVAQLVKDKVLPIIDAHFERGTFPKELIPELASMDLLGMHLEGYGCAGLSATCYGLASMELEAGDSGIRSFVSVQGSLAMFAIRRYGSEEQRQRWLPQMARGEVIGCFGLTEPDFGSNPAGMRTYARRRGSDWVIDGNKLWITNGGIADLAVVWTQTDQGIRGFLVERGTNGFTTNDIGRKLSLRASVTSELVLQDCLVPQDAMLPEALGLGGPLSCLNEARFGIVWGATGSARACLLAAVEYSKTRHQFGKPILFLGMGQKLEDLRPYDPKEIISGIFP